MLDSGRSPHGERGLKSCPTLSSALIAGCRSPHGERGLKSNIFKVAPGAPGSLPARGAWIEIGMNSARLAPELVAPRTGSVD